MHPHVMQPQYTDDVGAGGTFDALHDHIRYLQVRVPPRVYSPEPTKIILVVSLRDVQRAEAHFRGMGVQVVIGSQYLGKFIGGKES